MARRWGARTEYGMDVVLNIYDLSGSNYYLYPAGLGFYHTGVEINGREFTFSNNGVFYHEPRGADSDDANGNQMVRYRESKAIGIFTDGITALDKVIDVLKASFIPGSYHVVLKNCNHFSLALCESLVLQQSKTDYPYYVNRLAIVGSYFPCLLPGNDPEEANDNDAGAFENPAKKIEIPKVEVFKGEGRKLGSSSAYNGVSVKSEMDKIEAIRNARVRNFSNKKQE